MVGNNKMILRFFLPVEVVILAGCIDIPWQTEILSDYLDGCQESVPVYVKYAGEMIFIVNNLMFK